MNRPLTLTPKELDAFPANYHEARKALKTLSQSCPQLEDIQSYPLSGASNSEHDNLSTETLWLGPSSAENLVVLISATHGVEGFVGAAVQTDLLQRIHRDALLPANTALLMIFALNPFGFAQHRRCDERGIDLNRNFIDFSQPLPANKGYDQLQSAVYEENPIKRQALFEEFQRQQGQTAFEIALSGGQYSDRYGPFYGGHQ
ncbi:MAG: M14 family metallopeptidase, partial [Pseudomonadales bacterium]|nr:M14 family metallopeptidase [Pseudomonadales bacterium]